MAVYVVFLLFEEKEYGKKGDPIETQAWFHQLIKNKPPFPLPAERRGSNGWVVGVEIGWELAIDAEYYRARKYRVPAGPPTEVLMKPE